MARRLMRWIATSGLLVAALLGGLVTRQFWGPPTATQLAKLTGWLDPSGDIDGHGHNHGGDSHEHEGEDAQANRIELSEQAQQNIGLKTIDLQPGTFSRTITVPGIVIEKPGHSDVQVTAPLTGVVTQVYPLRGETLEPGDPIFRLRLTHEEIVQAQAELLRTTEELDVVTREIKRLEKITEGVVPGRTKMEREYEKQKQEAVQRAQKQALVLHGLTEQQVDSILKDRRLLKEVLIYAPGPGEGGERMAEEDETAAKRAAARRRAGVVVLSANEEALKETDPGREPAAFSVPAPRHSDLAPPRRTRFFELEILSIEQGQHVEVGKPLCRLGDHTSLYIEGRAFEREAGLLTKSVAQGWPVAAAFESGSAKPEIVSDLQIVYLANAVDKDSRAFPFYVELPNEVARDARTAEGHRFLSWKYKPGQRVQLLVPVEQWPNRLVVPAEAVVQNGAETYVFQRNGDLFDRRTVHVEYQDQRWAVLANDGSVFAGEHIVVTGAYQLHLAIKNRAGPSIDPHAGHNH